MRSEHVNGARSEDVNGVRSEGVSDAWSEVLTHLFILCIPMYTYTHLGATKPTFHSHFSLLVESTGVHRPLVGQEVSRSGGAGHLGHSLVIREGDCLPLSLLRLAIFSKGDLRAGVSNLQGHKDTGTQYRDGGTRRDCTQMI